MFQVEDNVPVALSDADELRRALSSLKVGESFVFPRRKQFTLRQQCYHVVGRRFKVKKIDSENSRVWRIA